MHERVGQRLGNYRLIRHLGHGGFADTYLGEHAYLKTFAAIKVLQTRLGGPEAEAFYNEARIIARLKHTNIVRLLDFGMEENVPYLAMEYAPNGTLRQFHPRGEVLSPLAIIPYVRQVASALQYAHDHKIIHRDIKPENILISANQEILLSDFGIALIAQSCIQSPQNIAGTVTYMAPEQIRGKPHIASDQYALGILVYEWLCGTPPFSGSYSEVAMQHEHADPPPLRQRAQHITQELERTVHTALAKDSRDRFSSIQDFATVLEQACMFDSTAHADVTLYTPTLPDDPQLHILTRANSALVEVEKTAWIYPDARLTRILPVQSFAVVAQQPPALPSTDLPPHMEQPKLAGLSVPPVSSSPVPQSGSYLLTPLATSIVHSNIPKRPSPLARFGNASIVLLLLAILLVASTQLLPYIGARFSVQSSVNNLYTQVIHKLPAISDPLNQPDNFEWSNTAFTEDNKNIGSCKFHDDGYYNDANNEYFITCMAMATNFDNLAYQVEMTIEQGQSAGMLIRGNANDTGYYFRIGADGSYVFQKMINAGNDQVEPVTLVSGSSDAIKRGLQQNNLLTIITRDSAFCLYINATFIDLAHDSTYKSGMIGVFADSHNEPAEALFHNASVWKL